MNIGKIAKTAGLILLGFIIGIVCTLAGWGYFIRHELSKIIISQAVGPEFADMFDSKKRLAKAQAELAKAHDQYQRWLAMTDLVLLEVEDGSLSKAQDYGNELLRISPAYRDDWNYGNAVHKSNLALGRVALRQGDTAKAKLCLLEAGKTPGSPQLDSFGPNMTLAKELLGHGEKDIVLQYFDECDKFWGMGHDDLRKWRALVKDGIEPDFGANLNY